MFSVHWGILKGLLILVLLSGPVFAQPKLPDFSQRGPNLSLDPFERLKSNGHPSDVRAPLTLDTEVEPAQHSDVTEENPSATPVVEEAVKPSKVISIDNSPPYNYTMFLDVDYVRKFSGGASSNPMGDDPNAVPSSTAYLGLLHFWGKYDTAKAKLWDNGAFVLHWIYGMGTSPTATVGDLRSVSNIDASFMSSGEMVMPGLDILELWYEHSFPFNQSSIRFGIGYLSSDFYKSKYTGLFLTSGINSIGTEILWNTMASNPPNTTLGLWYKTKLSENIYGQAVVFDGFPDHSTKVFDLDINSEEGIFIASEFGWSEGEAKKEGYFKMGVGAWYLSQNIKQNMTIGVKAYPGDPVATQGVYTVIDKAFDDKLGVFFKGGIAVNGINKFRHYFTLGITQKGIIESRPSDTIGLAVVQSKLSDTYIKYHGKDDQGNVITFTQETIYELTYSIPVNKWLMIQPDLQYVLQPGMNVNNKNAVVGIIRAEITLI